MGRGPRRWGPVLAAVLFGVVGAGALPASGAEPASYRLRVEAVAYHLHGRTALGLPVGKGIVAVDPESIPLGTRLLVPGYGKAIAADVGTEIKGRIIDLWMPSDGQARKWGRQDRDHHDSQVSAAKRSPTPELRLTQPEFGFLAGKSVA